MVTRRGYLSSTGGFADGFTSGFGLMNQAYTDKRKLDQAEENMQYERERDSARDRQTQANFEAQQAKLDRQYGLDQQRLEAQEDATEVARNTGLAQATAAQQRAETDAATEERLSSAADAEAQRKLGGFENEVMSNGNATARLIKTRVPLLLEGVAIEIDDDTDELEWNITQLMDFMNGDDDE